MSGAAAEAGAGIIARQVGTRVAGRAAAALLGGPVGIGIVAALTLYDAYSLWQLYNESHSESQDKDADKCTGDCNQAKDEKQKKRRKKIEDEAGAAKTTKGPYKQGQKEGGMDEANGDFDSLDPSGVKDIETKWGPGRAGTLEDGTKVTVRPGSTEGSPTLQIQNPSGRGTEIRYKSRPSS